MNFARARRARSPPLSWPTRLWTASPRNQKRPRRPLAHACEGGGFRTLLISSRRVREKSSSSAAWAKYPIFRFLPRNTEPASASWRPIRTSRRVVFPAPFGPTRPTLSPFASSRSTSEEEAAAVRLGDALEAHDPGTRGARAEGEAEGARGGRRRFRRIAPHLLDAQLAGEHLLVHLARFEFLDDRELALQFRLVPVALRVPGPRDRVSLHPVVGVIADVLEGAEPVDFDHLVRDRVEEELVVARQEHSRVDLLEERLDRLDRVDVHVVRRLVEQEDVLLLRVREGARGEDLGLLAAGEGAEPLVEELLADAEVIEDRIVDDHALAAGGAPGDVQGFVPGHARAGVRGVPGVRPGHPRLEAGELRLDPLRLRAGGGEDVPHDGLRRDVRDLREVAIPEARLEHEVPQVRRRLAGEEPEQGALPRAVRADEGDLVPRVEEEVGVLEDERGAPGLPEVPARDDRLHVPGASSPVPDEASPSPGGA